MLDDLILSPHTRELLSQYLQCSIAKAPSLILSGEKGLGKQTVGNEVARFLLNYGGNQIEKHPDFLKIEPIEGRITKNQMDEARHFADIYTGIAPRRVIMIDDADCLHPSSENSLLKILEDEEQTCVFIFIAHKPMLQTISSRCFRIPFSTIGDSELRAFLSSAEIDDVILAASDGKIGKYYKLMGDELFQEQVKIIVHTLNTMNHPRELLSACHAIKEKDRDYLFDIFSIEQCMSLYSLLMAIFQNHLLYLCNIGVELSFINKNLCRFYDIGWTEAIINSIYNAALLSRKKGRFSKNDFFDFLVSFINREGDLYVTSKNETANF